MQHTVLFRKKELRHHTHTHGVTTLQRTLRFLDHHVYVMINCMQRQRDMTALHKCMYSSVKVKNYWR